MPADGFVGAKSPGSHGAGRYCPFGVAFLGCSPLRRFHTLGISCFAVVPSCLNEYNHSVDEIPTSQQLIFNSERLTRWRKEENR